MGTRARRALARAGAVAVLAATLPLIAAAPAAAEPAPVTSVTLVGNHEPFAEPQAHLFHPGNAAISVSTEHGAVVVEVTGGTHDHGFRLVLDAPEPGGQLAVGRYDGALGASAPFDGRAGITLYGPECRGGRFTIVDLVETAGTVERLHALYEVHCREGADGPKYFGEVRWNAAGGDTETRISPGRIAWPDGYPAVPADTVPVTVENTSTLPLVVGLPELSGDGADQFTLDPALCKMTVPPGSSCTIDTRFEPTRAGRHAATMTVPTSAGEHTVVLRGTGHAGHTSWQTRGEGHDLVTGGVSHHWTPADSFMTVRGDDDHLWLTVRGADGNFATATLNAGYNDVLVAGTYEGTVGEGEVGHYPGNSWQPGLAVTGPGLDGPEWPHGSCFAQGRFTIHELREGPYGIEALSITYEHICSEGASYGSIAWRAAAPAQPVPGTATTSTTSEATSDQVEPASDGPVADPGTSLTVVREDDHRGAATAQLFHPGNSSVLVSEHDNHIDVRGFGGTHARTRSLEIYRPGCWVQDCASTNGPLDVGVHDGVLVQTSETGDTHNGGYGRVHVLERVDGPDGLERLHLFYEAGCCETRTFGEVRYNVPASSSGPLVAPSRVVWPEEYPQSWGRPVPVTVVNTSDVPIDPGPPQVVGDDAASFRIRGNQCTAPVPAGRACKVYVQFHPDRAGPYSAALELPLGGAEPHVVPLSGSGIAGHTSWQMTGDEGDPVTGGKAVSYSPSNSVITAHDDVFGQGVELTVNGLTATFTAGAGNTLQEGVTYEAAGQVDYTGPTPGLVVGRFCFHRAPGRFTVHEIRSGPRDLEAFSVTFVQECQDGATYGSIVYRATDPPRPVPGPDTTGPATTVAATPPWTRAASHTWTATATDPGPLGSGVATYDARYRSGAVGKALSDFVYPSTWTGVAAPSFTLPMTHGTRYCVSSRATDHRGNTGGWSEGRCTTSDRKPPVLSALSTPPAWSPSRVLSLGWGFSDPLSGVASYVVRHRSAPISAPLGSFTVRPPTTATSWSVTMPAGSQYCVSVAARDKAGNTSAWSPERCSSAALDDRAMSVHGTTRAVTSSAYYAGTARVLLAKHALVAYGTVHATRVGVVVSTCATCGVLDVYLNGVKLGQVSTVSATTRHKTLVWLPRGVARKGPLVLRTVDNRKVVVDAVVVQHR